MVKSTNKNSKKSKISSEKVEKKIKDKNNKSEIYSNYLKIIAPVIFILFVMWFAFFVRSGPINLNGLDDRVAANTYTQIHNLIIQDVNNKYKYLSEIEKEELISKEYKKVQETGVYNYQGQNLDLNPIISQNQKQVKDAFKAPNGQTYLNAIDPYHHLMLSLNYYENGYTGDKLINGSIPLISKQLAPNGIKGHYNPSFQIWIESELFKLNKIDKNSTIGEETKSIYLIGVVVAMLAGLAIYFLIRIYTNDLFALFGSLFLVSIGTFVSRTIAGFVDTDAYNVFYPILVTLFIILAFNSKKKYLMIINSTLAGFAIGMFIWSWSYGWFIFLFICLALLGYLAYLLLINLIQKIKVKVFIEKVLNDFSILSIFVISSFIFTYILSGLNIFKLTYLSLLKAISSISSISGTNIWPNVLTSVAELNPASFSQIISAVGGKIIFFIAMLGLVFLTLDFKSTKKEFILYKKLTIIFSIIWFLMIIFGNVFISFIANSPLLFLAILFIPIIIGLILSVLNHNISNKVFFVILLSIWTSGTIYMSLSGVRFILLLAPSFAISFAFGLYYFTQIINNFLISEFKIKNSFKQIIFGFIGIIILFLVLFYPIGTQAMAISKGTTPNFDDAWYSTMYKIENNSKSDAIITSWWDFGHFFAAVANRGVTFDGATQTTPQAHWVGKYLMENDNDIAKDILRMLVCGGNNAFDNFYSYVGKDNADAVKINKIIYSTFGKSRNETKFILENNKYYTLNKNQVMDILDQLKCESPREDFVIASGDMVGKAGVWAHWGSWDFTKKYVYDNYKTLSAQTIAKNIDENVSLINKYFDELKAIDIKANLENIKRQSLVNQWFAPYPSYIPIQGQYSFACNDNNSTLTCQNGIVIDMKTGKVTSQFSKEVKFNNLYYPSAQEKLDSMKIGNGTIDLLLVPSQSGFSIMMMQSPLGASQFTKMFYLNGFSQNYLKEFDSNQSVTGNKIKVFKVIWNSTSENSLKVNNVQFNTSQNKVNESLNNSSN